MPSAGPLSVIASVSSQRRERRIAVSCPVVILSYSAPPCTSDLRVAAVSGVRARKYGTAPGYAQVRSVPPQRAVRTTSTPDPGWPHPALCTGNKIRHGPPGVQTRPLPIAANSGSDFAAANSGRVLYLQRIAAGPKNPSREKDHPKIGYKEIGPATVSFTRPDTRSPETSRDPLHWTKQGSSSER